ncbi:hypothetical protein EVAR_78849_1 [Eumeta japonica]|uniref:Uncharacterized protein n=1 Tax=Eumeta variegata TaxID=151549 RepID=A0A4C1U342_EUMVA|nr:hypothetical protein EVAR_78849_1 [Eumeta japonica]
MGFYRKPYWSKGSPNGFVFEEIRRKIYSRLAPTRRRSLRPSRSHALPPSHATRDALCGSGPPATAVTKRRQPAGHTAFDVPSEAQSERFQFDSSQKLICRFANGQGSNPSCPGSKHT